MEVSISARNGELPESSQNRIEDKVRKLPRYFDRVTAVQVIANFQSHQEPEIEIVVSVEGTSDIVASSKGSNIISACDAALQKIERQLKKHKEKITQHRATGHKHLSETNADEEE